MGEEGDPLLALDALPVLNSDAMYSTQSKLFAVPRCALRVGSLALLLLRR
jgi:hypothetical protein